MTIMQRSPHKTDSFDQLFSTRVNHYYCTVFLLCKDPRTTQIYSTSYFYTRQSLLLHSIFVMQRSPHETDSFDQLCTCVNRYYCTLFLLCKDPCTRQIHSTSYFYTRQSLLLHRLLVMQRSLHETDWTSYVHASIIIIAQYFYYAKIPAQDRFE